MQKRRKFFSQQKCLDKRKIFYKESITEVHNFYRLFFHLFCYLSFAIIFSCCWKMQFLLQNAVFAAKCSFCCKCSFFALPITVASWKDWKRKKKMSEKIKSRNAYVFTGIQYKVIYLHNVQNVYKKRG